MSIGIPHTRVNIYSLELKKFQFSYFTLTCDVSSGCYVRSLVHDIGEKLKIGAAVVEVRCTRVSPIL